MPRSTINIAVLPGDGIGIEVIQACLAVITVVKDAMKTFDLNLEKLEAGVGTYLATGNALPAATLASIEASDAVLLGAMGHPDITYPDGTGIAPQLDLRFRYKLYAGVRPIRFVPGATTPLANAKAESIDLIIIRESTEGLLADISSGEVIDDRLGRDTLLISRETSTKLFDFAFKLARKRKVRGRAGVVTCVDKADVLRSLAFFRRIFHERAAQFPDIDAQASYVDATALNLVRSPWIYDVMVMENMFGDILSDLGAALIGGMGMAPSADIGDNLAVFQPSHGTAPDIAGTDRANPTAMILSAAMMFEWLADRKQDAGYRRAGEMIEAAVFKVYREGRIKPYEFGGEHGTQAIGREIENAIKEERV